MSGRSGLRTSGDQLTLNGQNFRIFSGGMHYFRIPHQYWRDRLTKLKECGLNTVEIYVPWNLHESQKGVFDFTNDVHDLNIATFITLAHELGLFVIFRPGPYICAEWEWGGHPAWLLRDPEMRVRTLYPEYTAAVESYFRELLRIVAPLQYTHGGPIIAVQIENEYGAYGFDKTYLRWMRDTMTKNGIIEFFFTSDSPAEALANGSLPENFATVNFQEDAEKNLMALQTFQPGRPLMVSEFWTGWFDHWGEQRHTVSDDQFQTNLAKILELGASFNLYMFHGGTNFGFLNGANEDLYNKGVKYEPDITSYDYDAPLSESGDVTSKYLIVRELMKQYNPNFKPGDVLPAKLQRKTYDLHLMKQYLTLSEMLTSLSSQSLSVTNLDFAERLPLTTNVGFIVYSKTISKDEVTFSSSNPPSLKLHLQPRGRTQIIVNGQLLKTIRSEQAQFNEHTGFVDVEIPLQNPAFPLRIVVLVENLGRVNYVRAPSTLDGHVTGVRGTLELDGRELISWNVFGLDFSANQIVRLCDDAIGWKNVGDKASDLPKEPALYRAQFSISNDEEPQDTFLNPKAWKKGVAFINRFNLGRYWDLGPQRTLYVPGPKLKRGSNEAMLFEVDGTTNISISFDDSPILG